MASNTKKKPSLLLDIILIFCTCGLWIIWMILRNADTSKTAKPVSRVALSKDELNLSIKQLQESANLINTTVNPDVFFGRLNFTLDLLLYLRTFESKTRFKSSPSDNYNRIISNLENTVDDFITRAHDASEAKANALKTEKGRHTRREKFANSLVSAFDCADTFWTGDSVRPHYTGPLFTEKNYKRVQDIYDAFDDN